MKHLVAMVAGSGLSITGAILSSSILSQLDWSRINQYGFFHELRAMTPIVIIAGIIGIIGLFVIFGTALNVLFHDGMEADKPKNKNSVL
jgi:hypothetical protein